MSDERHPIPIVHQLQISLRKLSTEFGNFDELESDEEVKGDVQLIVFPPRRVVTVSVDKSVVIWNADAGVCEMLSDI